MAAGMRVCFGFGGDFGTGLDQMDEAGNELGCRPMKWTAWSKTRTFERCTWQLPDLSMAGQGPLTSGVLWGEGQCNRGRGSGALAGRS